MGARTHEGTSDTDVYYDLSDDGEGATHLAMSIVIALGSLPLRWLAALGGTAGLWHRHQSEELDRLVTLVEATAPGAPLAFHRAA